MAGSALLRLNVEELGGDGVNPGSGASGLNDETMTEAQTRYNQIAPLAEAIRAALAAELDKLGFAPEAVPIADPAAAGYRLEPDRVSDGHSLAGEWRDAKGQKLGGLVFHEDGSFFVEHDVIRNHPRDDRWFVEAVQAWGRGADIRAEPRLLPVPA